MIDVTHEGDDRRAGLEFLLRVDDDRGDRRGHDDFLLVDARAAFAALDLQREAVLLAERLHDVLLQHLRGRGKDVHRHQVAVELERLQPEMHRHVLDDDGRLDVQHLSRRAAVLVERRRAGRAATRAAGVPPSGARGRGWRRRHRGHGGAGGLRARRARPGGNQIDDRPGRGRGGRRAWPRRRGRRRRARALSCRWSATARMTLGLAGAAGLASSMSETACGCGGCAGAGAAAGAGRRGCRPGFGGGRAGAYRARAARGTGGGRLPEDESLEVARGLGMIRKKVGKGMKRLAVGGCMGGQTLVRVDSSRSTADTASETSKPGP